MAISFVGYASNTGTTITLPTHQAGDLIVVFASTEVPSVLNFSTINNWRLIQQSTVQGQGLAVYYTIAASSAEPISEISGARIMQAAVYRSSNSGLAIGGFTNTGVSGTTMSFQQFFQIQGVTGDTWRVLFGQAESATADVASNPTGCTNRGNITDAPNTIAGLIADTNGNPSFPMSTITYAIGVTAPTNALSLVIVESQSYSGGAAFQLVGSGGLVY